MGSHHFCDTSVPSAKVQESISPPLWADPEQLLELLSGKHKHRATSQKPETDSMSEKKYRWNRDRCLSAPLTHWWKCGRPQVRGLWIQMSGRAVWTASQTSPRSAWEKPWWPSPDCSGRTGAELILLAGQGSTGTTRATEGKRKGKRTSWNEDIERTKEPLTAGNWIYFLSTSFLKAGKTRSSCVDSGGPCGLFHF